MLPLPLSSCTRVRINLHNCIFPVVSLFKSKFWSWWKDLFVPTCFASLVHDSISVSEGLGETDKKVTNEASKCAGSLSDWK